MLIIAITTKHHQCFLVIITNKYMRKKFLFALNFLLTGYYDFKISLKS